LVLSTQLLNGIRLKILTRILGLDLEFRYWMGLALLQSFLNYLPFKGGMAVNAVYLKKQHDFPLKRFIAMVTASCIITISASGLMGLIASGICLSWSAYPLVFIFFGGLFFLPGGLAVLATIWKGRDYGWMGTVHDVLAQWRKMGRNQPLLLLLFSLDFLSVFIFSWRYFTAVQAFSMDISFGFCIILACMAILSTFVAITPAGMGVREGIIGVTTRVLGSGLNPGICIALLDRAVVMFWVFILGPLSGFMLLSDGKHDNNMKEKG
jgi:uncharacterized membrane protein YbhN (UPF0104 family)